MHDSSLDALRKAILCSVKMGNVKQAAATLESTAREWSMLPGKGKETASELYAEASSLLMDAGEIARAADVMLLAGKQIEGTDKERAAKLFDSAAALFDGHDDLDVYAAPPLQKVLREQLNVGKHASAMRTLEKLMKVRCVIALLVGFRLEITVASRLAPSADLHSAKTAAQCLQGVAVPCDLASCSSGSGCCAARVREVPRYYRLRG